MPKKNKIKITEIEILQEINEKLNVILSVLVSKEENTDDQIKILCNAGFKSEKIGKLIGITGRGVRKNKSYRE